MPCLARIESGRLAVTIEAVDLGPLLSQVGEMVAVTMREHGVTYPLEVEGGDANVQPRVAADPTRLTQVLVNLLSNAAKYNRPQGSVRLTCRREGQAFKLSVTGIGLVITRHLVMLTQGHLEVQSEPDVGSTFTVTQSLAPAVKAAEALPAHGRVL